MNNKQEPGEVLTHVPQMSLRDWLAGQALNGILANGDIDPAKITNETAGGLTRSSYGIADAMLEARKK